MNLQNIFNELENVDPEVYDRLDSRRHVMQRFSFIGKTLAMAAIPTVLGSMLKKAYGQSTPAAVLDTLNFALTLEYLEAEFYKKGNMAGASLIPTTAAQGAIATIAAHEQAHVDFLKATIQALGGSAVAMPTFDWSAGNSASGGGPLGNTLFTSYPTFLAVAQTFEDTGVRAYKGQAGNLMSNKAVLTAALQIHSVEARHASHIRQMRRANNTLGANNVKPWITNNQSNIVTGNSGLDAQIQLSYNGEENSTQGNVAASTFTTVATDKVTEAFDEPLTKAQVLAIVDPFIV
ncbi:ferritin-like domain-containing protein [Flaviaesturariibacter flavus]|uniref:Ferritin-like domain-containing protein n=1 Tax=Flaviaesturariibacter flavus TaxID=2502780 RepID=A0A4V6NAY4_9BACT|nr:ferritin-like domain-containing protein [Flaviaesturariibacter flavus]TCJ13496.1 ferritin-like domain-containing protein [Flaviaesturariibacter flavus]